MEKEEMDFRIPYSLNWAYGIEISKLREDLDAVEKLGATHIGIEHGVSYDCSYVEIDAIARRMETDEEFQERFRQINQRQEEQKRREIQELERLKSKYGQ
jgi:hypothetical protein